MSADTRTVSFRDLLYATAHRCGLDTGTLATSEATALAEFLTVATAWAWRSYDWPDTMRIESRALRPVFDLAASYALGDVVYDEDSDIYYEALQDGFSGHPVLDGAFWAEADPFAKTIDLLTNGETPIGEVFHVWDADPALTDTHFPVAYSLTATALQLVPTAPNTVFVSFRLPPPRYTTTAWASGTAYLAGQLVYLAPHCYLALQDSTGAIQGPSQAPTRWREQSLPELFADAVKRRAKAEWMSAGGQDEKATVLEAQAAEDLASATQTLSGQQGQQRRYAVATRGLRQFQPLRA